VSRIIAARGRRIARKENVMARSTLIDEMGVANVGFLIENLGKDAGDLQYLRELVQNGIESILRSERSGEVRIDFKEIDGVKKLRITDNGLGMTADEVRDNINRLSASSGTQAFDKNFGIGAKITAAVKNPYGVLYETWKDGDGAVTVLGREDGHYGRIGFQNPADDSVHYSLPLSEEDKHSIIARSGVSVVLLGKSNEDDTTAAPPGSELPSQWVAAYLERRYFVITDHVTLKVQRPAEIFDSGRGAYRAIHDTVRGQRHYLDKHSESHGTVDLRDAEARVWWWILTEEITAGGKTWNNRGHVAAIYQDELYEVRDRGNRLSALKDFGVYAGHGRVVIYVEPTNVLGANTARTSLILKNGSIDYVGIGSAFADKMPGDLALYMAGQVSSEQADNRKSILRNLREVDDALEQARYRRSPSGEQRNVLPDFGGQAGTGSEVSIRASSSNPRRGDASGRVGTDYLRKAREELDRRLRTTRVDADPIPRIVWDDDGKTVQAGRAGTYTRASHVLTLNAHFDLYLDLLEWARAEAKERVASEVDEDTLTRISRDEVRRWFEEAMAQAVVVLRPLAHDADWGPRVFDTGLSDEGLTAAVISHRWLLMSAIKRGLAGRLGAGRSKVKDTAA
jgi:hypothetical protein